jgi:hypothetical protein
MIVLIAQATAAARGQCIMSGGLDDEQLGLGAAA